MQNGNGPVEGVSLGRGTCDRDTPRALLVKMSRDARELWIPKSVVDEDSDVREAGQDGDVIVALWWAEKNGLA